MKTEVEDVIILERVIGWFRHAPLFNGDDCGDGWRAFSKSHHGPVEETPEAALVQWYRQKHGIVMDL